ncbi:MAG TPA: hypothetical protein VLB46_20090 [Pyrinomonadaceae bacterium]|nr:hypothetical protein [Pyrinomonadaceae bacterium]
MKLLSWKIGLIVCFALGLLVLGGVVIIRQKRTFRHEHLQTSAWEPRAELHTVDYKLPKGETLNRVAELRYGHRNYYSVIKLYNHLEDEAQVAAGHNLRLPDMSVILADEGVTRVAAHEVVLILCSRAKYDRVLDELRAHRSQNQLSEDTRRELLEAADDLQQAIESLKQLKPGVSGAPAKTIGQLEQAMTGMHDLAEGHFDSYGYDIDMVQQRFALALTYAILWAREGFR